LSHCTSPAEVFCVPSEVGRHKIMTGNGSGFEEGVDSDIAEKGESQRENTARWRSILRAG
jgi:hypothetical protein